MSKTKKDNNFHKLLSLEKNYAVINHGKEESLRFSSNVVDKPQKLFTLMACLKYSPNHEIRTPTQIYSGGPETIISRRRVSTLQMTNRKTTSLFKLLL